MAIPAINEMLVPFLQAIKDKPHTRAEISDAIAKHFQLTSKDLQELHSGNNTLVMVNNMAFCDVHLCGAEFTIKTADSTNHQSDIFTITSLGLHELISNPDKISVKYLNQFKKP